MPKIDRRFIKSENEILKAFSSLLNKSDFEELTIQDVVDEADINKSTFYLHYSSLAQVLATLQDKLITDVFGLHQSSQGDVSTFLASLVDTVKKNKKIYRAVIASSNHSFYERIHSVFWNFYIESELKSKHFDKSLFLRMSLIHSVCNTLLLWCQGGCTASKTDILGLLNNYVEYYLN